jgi:hypothetical protein
MQRSNEAAIQSDYQTTIGSRSHIIAAEIVEDLQAALDQFAEIASDLKR